MNPLIVLATAVAVGMMIIPIMWRLAPRLGLMDEPDPRKVHIVPVARVGGWGIIIGALFPIALWIQLDPLLVSYMLGSIVLFVFGAIDDRHDIGHWGKFCGQLVAVALVIFYGGLYVERVPLMGVNHLPAEIGIPFTMFAMVGVINAINHSDGLDGLAGGESFLTLIVVAILAHSSDGDIALFITMSTLGGTVGFLRFNTHPARVFMGDCGSQFLGFTLAFLMVLLTQRVNPALSPALPILLLGLPVIDILAVLAQRIYHGNNWFKASRNHIHHRLLDIGFDHYETVVIIYSIQALLVISGLLLQYESDLLIIALYAAVCGSLFSFIVWAEHVGWHAHREGELSRLSGVVYNIKGTQLLLAGPRAVVAIMTPAYLIFVGSMVQEVPRDFGIASAVMLTVFLTELVFGKSNGWTVWRCAIYLTVMFVVYLSGNLTSQMGSIWQVFDVICLAALAGAVWLAVRYSKSENFKTTPTDFLIVFGVFLLGVFEVGFATEQEFGSLLVRSIILLYCCELLISSTRKRWSALSLCSLIVLSLFAFRGLS